MTHSTATVNLKAMREMETVLRTCNTGDCLSAGIEDIVRRYAAREEVVHHLGNGLVRIAILDKDGLLIGEYTAALSVQKRPGAHAGVDWSTADWSKTDAQLARDLGVSPPAVGAARRRHKG